MRSWVFRRPYFPKRKRRFIRPVIVGPSEVKTLWFGSEASPKHAVGGSVTFSRPNIWELDLGGATGGTINLDIDGTDVSDIHYDDSASDVETAITGAGFSCSVISTGSGIFKITFLVSDGDLDIIIEIDSTTGGSGGIVTELQTYEESGPHQFDAVSSMADGLAVLAGGFAGDVSYSSVTRNEKQSIAVSGGSGDYRLRIAIVGDSTETIPIAWNASAATIQSALDTVLGGSGNISVTGSNPVYTIEFIAGLGGQRQPIISCWTIENTASASISNVQRGGIIGYEFTFDGGHLAGTDIANNIEVNTSDLICDDACDAIVDITQAGIADISDPVVPDINVTTNAVTPVQEIQTITFDLTPDSGSWTINGITVNGGAAATDADVEAAIENFVGAFAMCSVSGSVGGPFTVTYDSAGDIPNTLLVVDTSALFDAGSTVITPTVATTTEGVSGVHEVHTITFDGDGEPTEGSWFLGSTELQYNADLTTIQSAVTTEYGTGTASGSISISGGIVITFDSDYDPHTPVSVTNSDMTYVLGGQTEQVSLAITGATQGQWNLYKNGSPSSEFDYNEDAATIEADVESVFSYFCTVTGDLPSSAMVSDGSTSPSEWYGLSYGSNPLATTCSCEIVTDTEGGETGTTLDIDKIVHVEYLQSLNINGQTNLESVLNLALNNVLNDEWNLSIEKDSITNIEYLLTIHDDGSINFENSLNLNIDSSNNIEYHGTLSNDQDVNIEFLLSLTQDNTSNYEYLSNINLDGIENIENLSMISIDSNHNLEYIGELSLDNGNVCIEYNLDLSLDSNINSENLLELQPSAIIPIEYLTSISRDGIINSEYSVQIDSDGSINIENSLNLASDSNINIEFTTGLNKDGLLNTEFNTTINIDGQSPLEYLITINGDGEVNIEYGGQLTVDISSSANIEYQSTLSSDQVLNLEYLASFMTDVLTHYEHLLSLYDDNILEIEHTLQLALDKVTNIEHLGSLDSDGVLSVEWLQKIEEALYDYRLNIEYKSTELSLAVGVLKWLLAARTRTYILNQRLSTYILNTRMNTYILGE